MNKAEKHPTRALRVASEKYPESIFGEHTDGLRAACIIGYHQAEKDLELTWEDMKKIHGIALQIERKFHCGMAYQEFWEEVLRRFKEYKEGK